MFQDDFEEERETNLSAVMAALRMWSDEDVVSTNMAARISLTVKPLLKNWLVGKKSFSL